MARYYKTGRTRTVRITGTVTVGVAWKGAASSPSGTLGTGSSYTTVLTDPLSGGGLNMSAHSTAFGVRGAVGFKATPGDPFNQTIALGVYVPALTGNGFVPVALATFGGSITATATLVRHLELIEVLDHAQNGRRLDLYGASGTCYETYTVNGTAFTTGGASQFVPGQAIGDGIGSSAAPTWWGRGMGYRGDAQATTQRGGLGAGAFNGGDVEAVWSLAYVDGEGLPIFDDPDAPTTTTLVGESRWGKVKALACAGAGRHTVSTTFNVFPRHGFQVSMAPLSLPYGAPHTADHRLEVGWRNPLGGTVPAGGYDFNSAGESVSLACGGVQWSASHSSTVSGESTAGASVSYNSLLPLVKTLQVTSRDALPHYYAHVRAPWSALGLAQAGALSVPGGSGFTVSAGTPYTLTVGNSVGYRWVRVTAHTTSGTATLAVASYLNGNTTTPTGSVSVSVGTGGASVDLDMLSVAGCTYSPGLRLEKLVFTATGGSVVVDTVQLIRKVESIPQVMSTRRSLAPLQMGEVLPWLICYTDGVESLRHAITGDNATGAITLSSQTVRQLVAEINGTSRPAFPSGWSPPFPFSPVIDGGAATSPSPLLGWTATDNAPPRPGKNYADGVVSEPQDWADSDVYLPALHGDGVIGSSLQLTEPTDTIQAQRFSNIIEPGLLPGSAGFDGTDGAPFGTTRADMHTTTPVRFVGVFRGMIVGSMHNRQDWLPVFETLDTTPGAGGTITPPTPTGHVIPRTTGSGFCHSNTPLKGKRYNGYRYLEVENAGGTPSAANFDPYHRERQYGRFWLGSAADRTAVEWDKPRGWLHLAEGAKVTTYDGNLSPLFTGADTGASRIDQLRVMVGGVLLVRGIVGSAAKLWRSGDGGSSVEEIWSMTNVASSLVEYDPARNWIVVLWESSSDGKVRRQVSRDGGDSWESATVCTWTPTGGSSQDLTANLLSWRLAKELAGQLVLVVKISGVGKVLTSGDGGVSWVQKL